MPVARAGLVAPAAQAQPAQLATGACAEGGLLGAVEPLAVAVLGGLPGGAVGGAGTASIFLGANSSFLKLVLVLSLIHISEPTRH